MAAIIKTFICTLFFCCLVMASAFGQTDLDARVWNVKIEGNQTFEDIVLKQQISNEAPSFLNKMKFWKKTGMSFAEDEVKRDVIRLQRFYQRRGFDEVMVSYTVEEQKKPWRKAITFEIVENMPIRIGDIHHTLSAAPKDSAIISDSENFSNTLEKLPFRNGRRFVPVNIPEAEGGMEDVLNSLGYFYAETEIKATVDSVTKLADIQITSNPGPRTRFDSVIVDGEGNLEKKYIVRETGIKKGEFYNENRLREAQREVFNHHLLRFALVSIPDQPIDSTINVLIRVKEAPLRAVELKFGIGNLTRIEGWGDFYKLFRGQASWTHRNVRDKGERFNISANASAIEQRLGSNYLFPYLFNTKSSITLSPFIQHKLEPSYEILRGGMVNSFAYQYSQHITGSVSYTFTLNNESARNGRESLPDSILTYNISSFNLNGFYSNGLREGRRGWRIQPSWELSGLFGVSTYSFQKTSLDVRKYTRLSDNITFAKRLYVSGIYFSKQDSLPSDIRLYNGGTNSVRGWNRLELGPKRPFFNDDGSFSHYVATGGRATINFNAEFRIGLSHLIKGFGIATFLDGGQVWRNMNDIGNGAIQYGVGGGLRYQSPIGPIRMDVAYKINPTSEDLNIYQGRDYGNVWDRWGIHLSIGQAF